MYRRDTETNTTRVRPGKIEVKPEEVIQNLVRTRYEASEAVSNQAVHMIERVYEFIDPAYAFRFMGVEFKENDKISLQPGDYEIDLHSDYKTTPFEELACCVCTLGPALEEECLELAKNTKTYISSIMDAVGIAFLDKLVQMSQAEIRGQIPEADLFLGNSFGPGLNNYPFANQRVLFDILDIEHLGLEMGEHNEIKPLNSITFFIPLVTEEVHFTIQPRRLTGDLSMSQF